MEVSPSALRERRSLSCRIAARGHAWLKETGRIAAQAVAVPKE
jgi:hypothetical protein